MVRWHEYGVPEGYPVVYFHGTPGSGVEARALSAAATRSGVRLIAPDRPGMGESRRRSSHSLANWPNSFTQLLDRAGVERAGILAWSGGGPFALACVADVPSRVSSVALMAPAELRAEWSAVQRGVTRLILRVNGPVSRIPGLPSLAAASVFRARVLVRRGLPARSWISPTHAADLTHAWKAAFAQGVHGPLHDETLITSNWRAHVDAAAAALRAANVKATIWHGEHDTVVSPESSRTLAPLLGARLHEIPRLGHRGVFLRHGPDALDFLARARHASAENNTSPSPHVDEDEGLV